MKTTILAKAIRTFEGAEGWKTPGSATFTVERQRFADLKANGLVEEAGGSDADAAAADKVAPELKAAAAPENKMAPDAENKDSPAGPASNGRRTAVR